MDITKEALQLFMKSLPSEDTYFQIISFGSQQTYLGDDKVALEYNQENLDLASEIIKKFQATMGGTSLAKPLQKALEMNPPKEFTKHGNYKKMIFVLTDGATDDSQKCI